FMLYTLNYIMSRCFRLKMVNMMKSLYFYWLVCVNMMKTDASSILKPDECGLDIMVVLDGSSSISKENKAITRSALLPMVDHLQELTGIGTGAKSSLISFILYGEEILLQVDMSKHQTYNDVVTQLKRTLLVEDEWPYWRHTRTDLALTKALQHLMTAGRPDTRKMIILETDGATFPLGKHRRTIMIAQYNREYVQYQIPILVIVFPNNFGSRSSQTQVNMKKEINAITWGIEKRIYNTTDFNDAARTMVYILDDIFDSSSTRGLDISNKCNDGQVEATQVSTTAAPPQTQCCPCPGGTTLARSTSATATSTQA
ncbi:unnamed protein product, partial [Owenia fusiformis]